MTDNKKLSLVCGHFELEFEYPIVWRTENYCSAQCFHNYHPEVGDYLLGSSKVANIAKDKGK